MVGTSSFPGPGSIGSVLHYGVGTRRGSAELHKTVFMQPQFIIDAVKFVIREPGADDINDELRKCDARIRKKPGVKEPFDEYLGLSKPCGAGCAC